VENRDGSFRASIGRSYFDHEVHGPAAAAACAILHNEGLSKDAIERAFARYEPLPHRMQFVGIIDGTRFVNDSKSTSFSSLAAAVRMSAPPVYLIAGGRLKGKIEIDVKEIVTFGVKKVYLIGECMDEMSLAWGAELPVERCGTLDKAVSAAHMDASNGGTILLSPGAASFDQFKDYTQRGDTFTNLVRKLKTKRG
jgi:UDP-N-acetylmuramoylalanine--D-glutamate ligase